MKWARRLQQLRSEVERSGFRPSAWDQRLNYWAARQRAHYRTGELNADQVSALESIPGWRWHWDRTGRKRPLVPDPQLADRIEAWAAQQADRSATTVRIYRFFVEEYVKQQGLELDEPTIAAFTEERFSYGTRQPARAALRSFRRFLAAA